MKRVSALIAGGLLLVAGIVLGQTGLLSFAAPSIVPDFTEVEVELTLPEEARIVAIEPISLDCRARVHARVPVEGTREHLAFGQVYRTDRVTLDAVGDVDTCVDGSSVTVDRRRGGTTDVVIPAESIMFVRPRVDTVATGESLTVSRGVIGKLTDAFPWVDDNMGLTPLAYAYAQNVIGSSECMQTAYAVTQTMLVDGYRAQFVEQGFDPDTLNVRIEGQPTFTDPADLDMDDVDMRVGTGAVTCVADGSLGGTSPMASVS